MQGIKECAEKFAKQGVQARKCEAYLRYGERFRAKYNAVSRVFGHTLPKVLLVATPLIAFNASSTHFYTRQQVESIAGASSQYSVATSTSFTGFGASGDVGAGTSTSSHFGILSGFLRSLKKPIQPVYDLTHYHWRNDNGTETTATSMTSGVQDTAITNLAKGSTVRLRVEISNEGGTLTSYTTQQFRLEYGVKSSTCAAISSWTDVGANSHWGLVNTANLTNGANTTNIAVSQGGVADSNATFNSTNGGVRTTGSQTAAQSVDSSSFVELEYAINALSAATDGGTYCFRITNAGSASLFQYDQYPTATLANGGSLTFTTDGGSESFPAFSPGTLVATTSILSVTTSNSTGFSVTVYRSNASATLLNGAVQFPDKTAWSAPGATTTVGNATASTTNPLTLQFRVRSAGTDVPDYASTWWGTDDTTTNARFAGFPTTAQTIINRSTAAVTPTNMRILYNLNAPVSQQTGTYTGAIIYSAVANP